MNSASFLSLIEKHDGARLLDSTAIVAPMAATRS
jgi:hypothetical protein